MRAWAGTCGQCLCVSAGFDMASENEKVSRCLVSGEYKLRPSINGRSDVWKDFGVVTDQDGKVLPYAACKSCFTVVSYTGRKSGTNSLKRHKCKSDDRQTSILTALSVKSIQPKFAKVTQADKHKIIQLSTNYVCKDISPFEAVDGDGLLYLIQGVTDLQFKQSQPLNVRDIIPHSTTVSRNIHRQAEQEKQKLSETLIEALKVGNVSFTCDMWTDSFKQRSYTTITAHWISENWTLNSRVLCTEELDPALKKTGVNVKAAVASALGKFGISLADNLERCIFTTDRGSNMIAALADVQRIDCIAHILNTVLRNTFDERKCCPDAVTRLLTASKSLVRYVKKTGLQNIIQGTLKQSVETRWNSTLLMIESLEKNFDDLQTAIKDHCPGESRRLAAIDHTLLTELIEFLKPFYKATNELEGQDDCTLHLVIPWIKKLQLHCAVNETDSPEIQTLKSNALEFIKEKFRPNILHKIAVFLNPRQKSMKVLTDDDRKLIMEYITDLLDQQPLKPRDNSQQNDSPKTPPTKRQRLEEISEFDDDLDNSSVDCELTRYSAAKVLPHNCTNILYWWKENSSIYPGLAAIAKNVLSVMSTSAASERNFSLAGHVVSAKRANLKGSSVNNILFLNSALRQKSN